MVELDLDNPRFEVLTLTTGEYDDFRVRGTFMVPIGLDWQMQAELFQIEKYKEAALKKDDYCWLSDDEFISWLCRQKIIKGVGIYEHHVELPEPTVPYEPAHWPMCPSCEEARGEPKYDMAYYHHGEVTRFHRCISCEYEWGHETEQVKQKRTG